MFGISLIMYIEYSRKYKRHHFLKEYIFYKIKRDRAIKIVKNHFIRKRSNLKEFYKKEQLYRRVKQNE